MVSHQDFLSALLDAFPSQVFLAARYEGDLELTDPTLRVFLPDFHWMSARTLDRYSGGYQFTGNEIGQPSLATLLGVLESLAGAVEIFQLGDRFDLWRELTRDDSDVSTAYQRVRNDASVSGLASRLNALKTTYIRGNHDTWLSEVENVSFGEPPSFPEREAADKRIFITHGHRYDNIEMLLPDKLKAELVGICPKIKPTTKAVGVFTSRNRQGIDRFQKLRQKASFPRDLHPTVRPDGARHVSKLSDIDSISQSLVTALDVVTFFHGTGDRDDFEHISYLTFGGQIMTFEQNHPSDHRLYVIGHTHHARILVDKVGGRPLVTLDCGGWIENCTVVDPKTNTIHTAPSRQVGVQCGNDVRIYQLGGNPNQ
jgi:UDP-2,3-diacylglucosamine pyrophosphatase LpxH